MHGWKDGCKDIIKYIFRWLRIRSQRYITVVVRSNRIEMDKRFFDDEMWVNEWNWFDLVWSGVWSRLFSIVYTYQSEIEVEKSGKKTNWSFLLLPLFCLSVSMIWHISHLLLSDRRISSSLAVHWSVSKGKEKKNKILWHPIKRNVHREVLVARVIVKILRNALRCYRNEERLNAIQKAQVNFVLIDMGSAPLRTVSFHFIPFIHYGSQRAWIYVESDIFTGYTTWAQHL